MKDPVMPTAADLHALALVEQGAILMLPGEEPLNFLVGHAPGAPPPRSFWFAAGGTDQSAAHLLEHDERRIPHLHAVEFYREGRLVGYLTTIAESELPNEAELRAQFAAWQGERARMQEFINEQLALLAEGN